MITEVPKKKYKIFYEETVRYPVGEVEAASETEAELLGLSLEEFKEMKENSLSSSANYENGEDWEYDCIAIEETDEE